MGAFYGSTLIKTNDFDAVTSVLQKVANEVNCKFMAGPPLDGWCRVYPDHNGQSDDPASAIARHLGEPIFHLMVHDSSLFTYSFYREGRLIDQYNSCPDYFGEVSDDEWENSRGRPELFQDLLNPPQSLPELKSLLAAERKKLSTEPGKEHELTEFYKNKKYIFEETRMEEFVEFFGFSNALSSYEYLQGGEKDDVEDWNQFVSIEPTVEFQPPLKPSLPGDKINRWIKAARESRSCGEFEVALGLCNLVLESKPDNVEALNERGRTKQAKRDLDGAIADFNKAIELKPDYASACNNRGLVKQARKDLAGAMADLNKALELDDSSARRFLNRGMLYSEMQNWDSALPDFERAIALKPTLAEAFLGHGIVTRKKGEFDVAMSDLNKALELKPDLAGAFNQRGLVFRALENWDAALADANKAIELKPKVAQLYLNRAFVRRAKGDLDGATADERKAVELSAK